MTGSRDPGREPAAIAARLSLKEKLSLLDGDLPFYGGIFALGFRDFYHRRPFIAGRLAEHGLHGVRFVDGPRGVVLEGGATMFPVSMARGASFDPLLEERIGEAIGRELRSHGGNLFGGVCINLLRHPAWGRAQETYGEDPVHLGQMGAALVRGVERHAMACVKHFAANSMENARFVVDVSLSPRTLHEMYLPHFKDCIDAGASAVMSAYNSVNGEWCGQNRQLLTEILKERWGFKGFVLTDFVFGLRDAERGARNGQDLEMPLRMVFADGLERAVADGRVSETTIDESVMRILSRIATVPPGEAYPPEVRACTDHTELARRAAAESIVLLKNSDVNDRPALPLQDDERVALFGELAAVPNLGDHGSSDGRPTYVVTPLDGLRSALGQRLEYDDGSHLPRAKSVAARADVAVVVVGYTHAEEGECIAPPSLEAFAPLIPPPPALKRILIGPLRTAWSGAMRVATKAALAVTNRQLASGEAAFGVGGDRTSLGLSPRHLALIRAIAGANPRTVVAIMAGSAVTVSEWIDDVAGVLMLWYPGMEGGHAFTDVLLGRANPSGRLPFVVPQTATDLPPFDRDATRVTYDLWHGYRHLDRRDTTPAFPFGFGLSYTEFEYRDLQLASDTLGPDDALEVSIDVTNIGARAGADVVQLYVGAIESSVERAPRELKAFAKVRLKPGQSQRVRLTVASQRLAYFDEQLDRFVVEPTEYRLEVGRYVGDPRALTATVRIEDR